MSTSSLVTMSPATARNGIGNASKSLALRTLACNALKIERDLLSADCALWQQRTLRTNAEFGTEQRKIVVPFAAEWPAGAVRVVGKDVDPVDGFDHLFQLFGVHSGREHAADDRAAARAGDVVDRDLHFFQHTNRRRCARFRVHRRRRARVRFSAATARAVRRDPVRAEALDKTVPTATSS